MTTGDGASPDPKAKFAHMLLMQRLSIIPLVVVLGLFIAMGDEKSVAGIPAMAIVAFAAVAVVIAGYYTIRYWGCPSCNKRLPMNNTLFAVKKCDKCGVELS